MLWAGIGTLVASMLPLCSSCAGRVASPVIIIYLGFAIILLLFIIIYFATLSCMHTAHYYLIIIVLLSFFSCVAVYLLVPSAEGGWDK